MTAFQSWHAICQYLESVSVVPVGLTKYREGLVSAWSLLQKRMPARCMDLIENWQRSIL